MLDFIVEIILETLLEGGMEIAGHKRLSRWIRYPVLAALLCFYALVLGLIVCAGARVFQESKIRGLLLLALAAFCAFGLWAGLRKKRRERAARLEPLDQSEL